MILQKYQGTTENEAVEAAKRDLGESAVIMHRRIVKPKGFYKLFKKPYYEVTAGLEENITYKKEAKERESVAKPPQEESAIEQKLNSLAKLIEEQVAATASSSKESASLKNDLEALAKEPSEDKEKDTESKDIQEEKDMASEKRIACLQLIYNQLLASEVDETYANELIGEIEGSLKKDATIDNVLAAVYQKIVLKLGTPFSLEDIGKDVKYIFFIGPTGVGKTTTIAKIASLFKLVKKTNLALLTADTYRIAAVEQLNTYAGILSVPLKVVYSASELSDAKPEMDGFDMVLIDTAGRSHKNKEQTEDIKRFIDAIPENEREVFLVLSAATKYKDLVRIVETYSEFTGFKLIFTKLDETGAIGCMFNVRMLTGAPLSYMTWGQQVPDDIGRVDAQAIAKQLLSGGDNT
jgi:flagellar biosynthesis protein FlhF